MASKVAEKTSDLIVHILKAFKHAKSNDDSALTYIRKGCEAMCKIIIMQRKGGSDGMKIINGALNNTNFSIVSSGAKSLDLFKLIETCKFHKWFNNQVKLNENLYHKFEDLRKYTNKGSHDTTGCNSIPSEHDIHYCIIIFKKIITWFWEEKLLTNLPQELMDGINNMQIDEEILIENSNWNYLADLCDNFSSTTQNFLISPSS
ncbi:hypothetical protein, partial [Flavobacterium sp. UGB4466]|uniref:hypothetical protein n=1 Tax=Flavobacterium sp. UGB4466 TaxID=2730889 RepID=UPI00192A945E